MNCEQCISTHILFGAGQLNNLHSQLSRAYGYLVCSKE